MSRKNVDFDNIVSFEPIRSRKAVVASRKNKPKRIEGVCSFQGKLKYSSRKAAHTTLKSVKNVDGRHEVRAYKCPHCETYHLTSQKASTSSNEYLAKTMSNIFNRKIETVDYSVDRVSKIRKIANSIN